jgi:class 3 adenylate cyclase
MTDFNRMDRTWLCSVVFMDIAEYSSQSVELQMKWKNRFNGYLGDAIKEVPESERVILDTGDGAAICFLGAPEAAMFAALQLCGAFVVDEREHKPGLQVRVGINLGPVKLVKDFNGALNAIGDGINAGQRIMSFASANQILVSQSFFEVVSRLSDDYKLLFQLKGVERDKHVREHTVYHLAPPSAEERKPVALNVEDQGQPSMPLQAVSPTAADTGQGTRKRRSILWVACASAVILLAAVGAWRVRGSAPPAASKTGTLRIQGAPAGTEVRLDQSSIGVVPADGRFSYEGIAAGAHELELRAARYQPKRLATTFSPGQTVTILGADAALAAADGALRIDISPPNATVFYSMPGQPPRQIAGRSLNLPEGSYVLTAKAPGLGEQTQTVDVKAGAETAVNFKLAPRAAPAITMDSWTNAGWTKDGAWYLHKGGGFVLFPSRPVSGSFVFTASRRARLLGNGRIQWFLDYSNERNYLLFSMDKNYLYCTEVTDGKRRDVSKRVLPQTAKGDELQRTLRIDVTKQRIVHSVQRGANWISLDTYDSSSENLASGSFGFYLPGSAEISIAGFQFQPAR